MKTKAIILAAGFGKRTQGVLNHLPKTLIVTRDGKTILDHLLIDLINNHQTETIIITNDCYWQLIKDHVNRHYPDAKISILNNGKSKIEEKLGALGDLSFALDHDESSAESYLVLPSDTTYWRSFSLESFITFVEAHQNDFVTIVRDVCDPLIIKGRFGCAVLNTNNKIVDFIEKPALPPSTFAAVPLYVYRKKHLEILKRYIRTGGNLDSPGSIISYLTKNKITVSAYIVNDKIVDSGTPEDIEKAKEY